MTGTGLAAAPVDLEEIVTVVGRDRSTFVLHAIEEVQIVQRAQIAAFGDRHHVVSAPP